MYIYIYAYGFIFENMIPRHDAAQHIFRADIWTGHSHSPNGWTVSIDLIPGQLLSITRPGKR